MVLTVLFGVLVVALLVKIVMGPRRWHRAVTEHTRPGSAVPSPWGEALVAARDVAALGVLGVLLGVALVHWVGEWRTDERLYETTLAAVDILPDETLYGSQVESLVEELTGHEVLLVDVSHDDGTSLEDVHWAPDDESVAVEDQDLPAPAACLSIDRTSTGLVEVTEGSCGEKEE